jgi:gliotoxin/aspirochlorine biosynthesis thioredoxin reductase
MFCHGYEERGAPSAGLLATELLSNAMFAPPVSRMVGRLAGAVNIYTDGNEALGAEIRAVLKSTKKFRIENRKIQSFRKDPDTKGEAGILVTLQDGTVNKEGFVVSKKATPAFPSPLISSVRLCHSRAVAASIFVFYHTPDGEMRKGLC